MLHPLLRARPEYDDPIPAVTNIGVEDAKPTHINTGTYLEFYINGHEADLDLHLRFAQRIGDSDKA